MLCCDSIGKLSIRVNLRAVDFQDNIVLDNIRFVRRRPRKHREVRYILPSHNERAVSEREIIRLLNLGSNGNRSNTEKWRRYFPGIPHFFERVLNAVYRNGKTDILRSLRHRHIHTNHVSRKIEKWPAGISGIDSGIRLDNARKAFGSTHARSGNKTSLQSGNNTPTHGIRKLSQRISDSDCRLSNTHMLRITKIKRRKPISVDFQDSNVLHRIARQNTRHMFLLVTRDHCIVRL